MKSKSSDFEPIKLPDPYDLKKVINEQKSAGVATKYGIAWMSDDQLKSCPLKQGKTLSSIGSTHFTNCVLANNGAGWSILESHRVKALLISHISPNNAVNAHNPSDQNLEEWLKCRKDEINSWIQEATNESPDFKASCDAIGAEKIDFRQLKPAHLVTLSERFKAERALYEIDVLSRKFQKKWSLNDFKFSGKGRLFALAKFISRRSENCTDDYLAGVIAGYAAGLNSASLRARLANENLMKMAIQTGSGRKSDKRTLWLSDVLTKLEMVLGRKAKTKEILDYIENKNDPVSKELIWIHTLPGDDDQSIQWSDSDSWSLKRFRDRISRIRKIGK